MDITIGNKAATMTLSYHKNTQYTCKKCINLIEQLFPMY